MSNAGIYRITISRAEKSDRFYIGQSVNLSERQHQHFRALRAGRHYNSLVQRAFNKYGEAAVSFDTVFLCDKDFLTIYEQEILDGHIKAFGASSILNVMRECVTSHAGVKRSRESIERLAAANRGKKRTTEQIERLRLAKCGFKHTQETKDKISRIAKGRKQHPNTVAAFKAAYNTTRLEKLRAALAGKPKTHSDETKRKIAASLTGKKQSADLIERRISKIRGRKQPPQDIAKRVASRLANAAKRKITDGDAQWRESSGGPP